MQTREKAYRAVFAATFDWWTLRKADFVVDDNGWTLEGAAAAGVDLEGDEEAWGAALVEVDPAHAALRPGDQVYCPGVGSDVVFVRREESPAAVLGRQGGRIGGKAKTRAKRAASRANGAKGGTPRKHWFLLFGEGEYGIWGGPHLTTARGIRARATKERAGGDRWCSAWEIVPGGDGRRPSIRELDGEREREIPDTWEVRALRNVDNLCSWLNVPPGERLCEYFELQKRGYVTGPGHKSFCLNAVKDVRDAALQFTDDGAEFMEILGDAT
jgi:hypothetical protein